MSSVAEPSHAAARSGAWMACFGLAVLVVATIFGSVDRQILVLLADPIRRTLALTDTRLGLVQGAGITLFAGLAAVPVGWLADRFGRRPLLAACVLTFAAGTAACGLAQGFASLFAAAILLGIGEAGLGPIVYALIPDVVPERRRALANGIYTLAAILGTGLGIALSGALVLAITHLRTALPPALATLEPWRLAFLAVATPGPLVALLVALIRLHPGHLAAKGGPAVAAVTLARYVRDHARTLIGVFGGNGLAALGLAATANWLPVLATRRFGDSAAQVGQGVGAAYMLGTLAGAGLGGAAVKWLRPRLGVVTPIRVLATGLALAACAALLLLAARTPGQLYAAFGVQVASLIAGSVLAPTMLQDMTPAALRSRVIAFGTVVTVALSAASPVLVGVLSDLLSDTPAGLAISVATVGAASLAVAALLFGTAGAAFARAVHVFHPHLSSPESPS